MPDAAAPKRNLAELQSAFRSAVLGSDDPAPPEITSHSSPHPKRRFEVYRNNVAASLTSTIAARFPVVQRLVGEEFFQAMALYFVERAPPRSPVLIVYGEGFPSFLETFEPVADLPYLPDVARLEWLQTVAFHAADAKPLTPGDFEALALDRIGDRTGEMRFALHPSIGLISSHCPIYSIWRTNTHDAEVVPITPDHGAEQVMVSRPDTVVEVAKLPPGAYDFIAALRDGATLAEAADRGGSSSLVFNLQSVLAGVIRSGALVTVETG